ncbi:hypothetical protein LW4_036 [Lactococcus phage LW4]|mgnify:FL=1|nr:hypothetical protein H1N70_gp35 [Lactococcus phage LW31]YP_009900490.1 hypothetical protein H1N71_gp40 [Lactococcus phage AM6]ARM65722.1 hypothetical protein LW32_035 [Lactococcus phage LW32]ARM65810.1 hypothetical protein LW33_036 [Lactococcus phage LW33]ARM65896.1 hypothetical protein LW4_036 [Lactococcus phage LW4]ARM66077.1 hypothetical protein AM7_040 [Lactococcus phage AM7]ARM65637.1 hypothetical protein LW31_035 [Lactococcus phage LW31]
MNTPKAEIDLDTLRHRCRNRRKNEHYLELNTFEELNTLLKLVARE